MVPVNGVSSEDGNRADTGNRTDEDGHRADDDRSEGRDADERTEPVDARALSPAQRRAVLRVLADRSGEVATDQRRAAISALDDGTGVPPETRWVLSTMAVRLAVRVVSPFATPLVDGDDRAAVAVAELFAPSE
ncbi:hypothetical protein [Salinigranum salinum]|uniref:hypothetical protein n=1 Tax=Salinigranum salinum TaxID=1364937 RepID=UPI0012612413|nr:hypothetical protein [Salinigranum salinum]